MHKQARAASRWAAPAVAVLAGALVAAWSVAAIMMSTRGFDITDEGYYVLSYRDWDTNLRTFTGSQYVYGPVFDLLRQSVPALRLVRLGTVLLAHAGFAWAFMTWLNTRPSGTGLSTSWCWAGGMAIVASGGVVYGWLPLSPGYNDVSALGSLTLVACVLRVARACEVSGHVPVLPLVAMGPVMVAILLAKSVAGLPTLVFVLAVLALVLVLGRVRANGLVAAALALGASVAVSLLSVNALVMPFRRMIPAMQDVNSLVAAGTNSPLRLVVMYVGNTLQLISNAAALVVLPVVLLVLGATLLRADRRGPGLLVLAGAAPLGLLVTWPGSAGLPPAGSQSVLGYASALTAMALLVAGLLAVTSWRRRPKARWTPVGRVAVVPLAIAVLPAVQAFGTGNELYVVAVNQVACWTALMVLATVVVRERPAVLVPILSATVSMTVVAAGTGVGGLLLHPYRTDSYRLATERVGGHGVLAGLKVSPQQAQGLERLLAAVDPEGSVHRESRVVMAFDEMPGLVLFLDARTPGEAWYSATDRSRTAAGIQSSCPMLRAAANAPPIALFNRPPEEPDRAALRECGIVLTDDPARVRLVEQPGVLVYSTSKP